MSFDSFTNNASDLQSKIQNLDKKFQSLSPSVDAAVTKDGIIIKFDPNNGYGFVRGHDGRDYFFRVECIKGIGQPRAGMHVKFSVSKTPPKPGKAPKIDSLVYDLEPDKVLQRDRQQSNRVKCPKCGKWMIPRVVFSNGVPDHTICPFCLETYFTPPKPKVSLGEKIACWIILIGFVIFLLTMCSR